MLRNLALEFLGVFEAEAKVKGCSMPAVPAVLAGKEDAQEGVTRCSIWLFG